MESWSRAALAGASSGLSAAAWAGRATVAEPLVWADAAALHASATTIAIATRFNIRTRLRNLVAAMLY